MCTLSLCVLDGRGHRKVGIRTCIGILSRSVPALAKYADLSQECTGHCIHRLVQRSELIRDSSVFRLLRSPAFSSFSVPKLDELAVFSHARVSVFELRCGRLSRWISCYQACWFISRSFLSFALSLQALLMRSRRE